MALIKWRRGRTAAIIAPVDQGDGGQRINVTSSEGVSGAVPHVVQPLVVEPEDTDADQHSRLHNLPTSTTSVTCRSFHSLCPETTHKSLTFFFIEVHFCVSQQQTAHLTVAWALLCTQTVIAASRVSSTSPYWSLLLWQHSRFVSHHPSETYAFRLIEAHVNFQTNLCSRFPLYEHRCYISTLTFAQ